MDLRLFRPALDSKGLLSVDGTDILGAGDFSFGLILDGGLSLVPFDGFVNDESVGSDQAERPGHLVDQLFTGTLQINFGVANLLVLGAQVPVRVLSGPDVTVPGEYNVGPTAGLDSQGLADLSLHAKLRLLRVERDPVGLAAILHVGLPTGAASELGGDPGVTLWPEIALEWRPWRPLRLAFEVGYRALLGQGATIRLGGRTEPAGGNATSARLLPGRGAELTWGDVLTFGAGASVRVGGALDLVAEAYGSQIVGEMGTPGALSVEAVAGIKVFVERSSYLTIGGGLGLTRGVQAAEARGLIGFVFEPSIGDRDGDGYKDDDDQCPDEPEDFDVFADEDGCPDPDNDRDGILDVDDECPLVPEDRDGDADEDGCPEGNAGDRDGDGILDQVDACPDEPEDRDGFQDEEGCPDPDNDQDRILDVDDLCPDDAEDEDGFEDEDGCPDPDNDGDRILDVDDQCPDQPETYNGTTDEDGCPDHGIIEMGDRGILLLRKIYFETDSARILERSYPVVDAIAAALNGAPQITLVEIQGHADERATDDYNLRLTRDRAAAVLEALVARGVARERMRSAGYGERCPVDLHHGPAAWEHNRRVEVKIIRTQEGPTGAIIACPAGRDLIPRGGAG